MGTKKAKKWPQVRIDEESYNRLKKMAKKRGESMSQLLALLINK